MSTEGLLWVDKHRPSTFSELSYHSVLTKNLQSLSNTEVPHLLFYGPSGAGKRTRVHCVLRALFGQVVEKKKVVHRTLKVETKQIEVTTVASAHHIEVNPSESGNNDRLVVQELIKDMASSAPLDMKKSLKVIVLHDVDQMSQLAQQALRRTMERYSKTCRVIMVAESITKVLEPLRSRCLGIRVALPSKSDIGVVLQSVAHKEGITLPDALVQRIAETSGRNLRRALLQFEATRVSVGALELPSDAQVMLGDWEYVCQDLAVMLTRSQTAHQLIAVRKKLQELLAHAVPGDVILRRLLEEILRIADDEICPEICRVAAKFDRNLTKGTKPIFHLEAFAARFMQIYAAFLKQQAAMMD
ncbi:Replication factor C subunit 3 [Gracilariopsis chorda]|uniref:Replication factor C subunit 3 n=1 Tax=Gracilariopsis chorda TaxID=448386 RepID=A0A2V3IZS0_9FLOR|nr:Replication factor C subunit 3 [Gracilariopsis chorda]|eukprot:PXF47638.1 Replication factor C subunit 3 [Gracilariopsis chorda]